MSLRVRPHMLNVGTAAGGPPSPPPGDSYLSRLVKMIPAEALALYGAGVGIIGRPAVDAVDTSKAELLAGWSVVCAIAVVVLRWKATTDALNPKPQIPSIVIALISFVIWLYAVGGPFEALGWSVGPKEVGSLAILAWTFFVPIFYKGD
jgi:hypothetical protein